MSTAPNDKRTTDMARAYTQLARITRNAGIRARGSDALLSLVDHSLVDYIERNPGCMAVDIARSLRLNRSTISRQLTGLFDRGLLEITDTGAGNAKPLNVTPAGRDVLAHSINTHRDGLAARLSGWSDDDVALFADLLERLAVSPDTQ